MNTFKQYLSDKKLVVFTVLYGIAGGWFIAFFLHWAALNAFRYERGTHPIEIKVFTFGIILFFCLLLLLFLCTLFHYRKSRTLANDKKVTFLTHLCVLLFGFLLAVILVFPFVILTSVLADMNLYGQFFK